MAVDAQGTLYIGSYDHNRIFKVDTSGVLRIAAGNGGSGSGGGDGGPATGATLDQPAGVAADSALNLYFVDGVTRVRRVDASGTITTVAGGLYGFAGDGGPAVGAALSSPNQIALSSSGDLYIADRDNQRIRRVDGATGVISTVAGTGHRGYNGDSMLATQADLADPAGVAVDAAGNILIADTSNQRIRRIDSATGQIETIAGNGVAAFSGDGGPAVLASFANPYWLALDAAGNLFITDVTNRRVRRVSVSGDVQTVAGTGQLGSQGDGGPAVGADMGPQGIAIDPAGNLVIADEVARRVRRVDAASGIINAIAGNGGAGTPSGDGGPALAAALAEPSVLALMGNGDLLIADRGDNRVRRVERSTGLITTVAGNGTSPSSGDGGPATQAGFNGPSGLAVDEGGNIFVVDQGVNKVRRVDAASGVITTIAGSGMQGFCGNDVPGLEACFSYPWALAADAAGNLYIADTFNNRVERFDAAAGTVTTIAGNGGQGYDGDGGPATLAALALPFGVAVDRAGRFLYIADTYNFRVRRVDLATGVIGTFAGDGNSGSSRQDGVPATSVSLASPWGLSLDAEGNLLISDASGCQIKRVVVSTGLIYRIAGVGSVGFSGDGGPALDAVFAQPTGAVADSEGNLYIADQQNRRVRTVANAIPVAGAGPDQRALPGAVIQLDGAAYSFDADGDALAFEWRNQLGTVVGSSASLNVLVSDGTQTFSLTVSDGWGGRASDSVLVRAGRITVKLPQEGERWRIGSTQRIKWLHDLGAGTSVRIELSRDGGSTWNALAAAQPNINETQGGFDWKVTGPEATNALVRVTSVEWPAISAVSGRIAIRQ